MPQHAPFKSKKRKHTGLHQVTKPGKKTKVTHDQPKKSSKGKERAFERPIIPIPAGPEEEELELSDQDLDLVDEHGSAAGFLTHLDPAAIAKNKNDLRRLHQLSKPSRPPPQELHSSLTESDSGSISDHEATFESSLSDIPDDDRDISDSELDRSSPGASSDEADSDVEIETKYETARSRRKPTRERGNGGGADTQTQLIERLPIKLADGTLRSTGVHRVERLEPPSPSTVYSDLPEDHEVPVVEDVSTGARFGRAAVIDVVTTEPRPERIRRAKEQLAGICQDIIADPETHLGLLRRLHSFALPEISSPSHPEAVKIDPVIRKYAILSQLAVFKDIIPGYHIRTLSDKEKAEKVTHQVQRTRDWEQALLGAYHKFLANAEAEVKAKSDLADTALKTMCSLLIEVTHFNFRTNILSAIITQMSRKSWTEASELCYATLVKLFKQDATGEPSLEAVRVLNRMIKERHYEVHPKVISCLLHLRLKKELNVRASQVRADKDESKPTMVRDKDGKKMRKKDRPHLSKNAKKALKENKVIEAELKEAEAEVDRDARTNQHTETLKLVFVLYFSILKSPSSLTKGAGLLHAALEGISKFAHLVNIDFFEDLMEVLRDIGGKCKAGLGLSQEAAVSKGAPSAGEYYLLHRDRREVIKLVKLELRCILSAFELLTGQGEALNLSLDTFINDLYGLIFPVALLSAGDGWSDGGIEPQANATAGNKQKGSTSKRPLNTVELETNLAEEDHSLPTLFVRNLTHIFSPSTFSSSGHARSDAHLPIHRLAAFSTRLVISTLFYPPTLTGRNSTTAVVLSILNLIGDFLARHPTAGLDAFLTTVDRVTSTSTSTSFTHAIAIGEDSLPLHNPLTTGCAWYPLLALLQHPDPRVRELAKKISAFVAS